MGNSSELKDGEKQIVDVSDMETYEMRTVRAILVSSPEKLPRGDTLSVRWQCGYNHSKPWVIEVVEEMGTLGETVAKDH